MGFQRVQAVTIGNSAIMQPMDIQAHYQQTIQTQAAASVAGSNGTNTSVFVDSDMFDKVSITLANSAATASIVDIEWSHDGVTVHGKETILASAAVQYRAAIVDTKARYFRVVLTNADATARTMSAWAYLKA